MSSNEHIKELEALEERYGHQIELRDKLIKRLLAEADPLCEECSLILVCSGGAKYEVCAAGLLAALEKANKEQ